jgi:hypothetical protein
VYVRLVSVLPEDNSAADATGYWRQWLQLVLALGWLLLAATISFVPSRRRPAGELPMWKQVVWVILFSCAIVFYLKG